MIVPSFHRRHHRRRGSDPGRAVEPDLINRFCRTGRAASWRHPSIAMAMPAGRTFAAELACEGPFAKDSDHKRLVAAFWPLERHPDRRS